MQSFRQFLWLRHPLLTQHFSPQLDDSDAELLAVQLVAAAEPGVPPEQQHFLLLVHDSR